eukprot:Selendium_serpulae@DN5456_c1_g2_i1.p1
MKVVKMHFDIGQASKKDSRAATGSALMEAGRRGGGGFVTLIPEEPDDIWLLYNVIFRNDRVRARTMRKVTRQYDDAGSKLVTAKHLSLTLRVLAVDYDGESDQLFVRGVNLSESAQGVPMGVHHTFNIGLASQLTIAKGNWEPQQKQLLIKAANGASSEQTVAVLIDSGVANIYLLTENLEKELGLVRAASSRRKGDSSKDKAFFESVLATLDEKLPKNADIVIIAGPGFVKDHFHQYILESTNEHKFRRLSNKSMYVKVACASALKQSLKEVLRCDELKARLTNVKATAHIRAIDTLYAKLSTDPHRVCYGPAHVKFAAEHNAVRELLILDSLLRDPSVGKRRWYSALNDQVEQTGGTVHVFSSKHTSGEQLKELTGVAALLRYPLLELDDIAATPKDFSFDGRENDDDDGADDDVAMPIDDDDDD